MIKNTEAMPKIPLSHISQSMYKDVALSDGDYCPWYIRMKHHKGVGSEPTPAMKDGLYFEQGLLGRTRNGELIEFGTKKDGTPYKKESDLLGVIEYAKRVCRQNKIEFKRVQYEATRDHMIGHPDAYGTFNREECLFDVKYTGMTYGQWEKEIKWNNTVINFLTQARYYQAMHKPMPFYFLVFSQHMWCRIFLVPYDEAQVDYIYDESRQILKYYNYKMTPYEPTRNIQLCNVCSLAQKCKRQMVKIKPENLIEYDR